MIEANKHADPNAALGTVAGKDPNRFVSLGAGGALTLAINGKIVRADADDDVTVFVAPDTELRGYRVEALSPDTDEWVSLSESVGTTRSFALKWDGLTSTAAIRITDTSGRTRDDDGEPLERPGVSVRGLGVLATGTPPQHRLPPFPQVRKGAHDHPVKTLQHLLRAPGQRR